MKPYERFEAWKVTHGLPLEIYRITDQWPVCERYQLTAQIRRAALSVPTNIAEGKDRGMLDDETFLRVDELSNRAGKVTWGLYASLAPGQSP